MVVTQGAVKLFAAAQQLDANLGPNLQLRDPGRAASYRNREEMFLVQLHELALVLNEGFQNRILQILSRHEALGIENQASGRQDSSLESNIMGSARVPSADLMFHSDLDSTAAGWRRASLQNASTSNILSSLARFGSFLQKTESAAKSVSALTSSEYTSPDTAVVLLKCIFDDGIGAVEVHPAPVKT